MTDSRAGYVPVGWQKDRHPPLSQVEVSRYEESTQDLSPVVFMGETIKPTPFLGRTAYESTILRLI